METRLLAIRGVTKSQPHLTAPRLEMTRYSLEALEQRHGHHRLRRAEPDGRLRRSTRSGSATSRGSCLQPFTPEAGEMWSKEDIDEWIDVLAHVVERGVLRPRDRAHGAAQSGDPPARRRRISTTRRSGRRPGARTCASERGGGRPGRRSLLAARLPACSQVASRSSPAAPAASARRSRARSPARVPRRRRRPRAGSVLRRAGSRSADVTRRGGRRARRRRDGRAVRPRSTSWSRTPASSRPGATLSNLDLAALDRTLAVNVRGVAATIEARCARDARERQARSS